MSRLPPPLPLADGPIRTARRSRRRIGYLTWSLVLGVLPTAFMVWVVLFRKVDGGFYMPPEFMQMQRQATAYAVALLITPQVVLVILLIRSVLRDSAHRLGRLVMATGLATLTIWLWGQGNTIREIWDGRELSAEQVARYAATEVPVHAVPAGTMRFAYEARRFTIHVAMPYDIPAESVDPYAVGAVLCVQYGRLFSGPVDRVSYEVTGPNGVPVSQDITREQCRSWFLAHRVVSRRPLEWPPFWFGQAGPDGPDAPKTAPDGEEV